MATIRSVGLGLLQIKGPRYFTLPSPPHSSLQSNSLVIRASVVSEANTFFDANGRLHAFSCSAIGYQSFLSHKGASYATPINTHKLTSTSLVRLSKFQNSTYANFCVSVPVRLCADLGKQSNHDGSSHELVLYIYACVGSQRRLKSLCPLVIPYANCLCSG